MSSSVFFNMVNADTASFTSAHPSEGQVGSSHKAAARETGDVAAFVSDYPSDGGSGISRKTSIKEIGVGYLSGGRRSAENGDIQHAKPDFQPHMASDVLSAAIPENGGAGKQVQASDVSAAIPENGGVGEKDFTSAVSAAIQGNGCVGKQVQASGLSAASIPDSNSMKDIARDKTPGNGVVPCNSGDKCGGTNPDSSSMKEIALDKTAGNDAVPDNSVENCPASGRNDACAANGRKGNPAGNDAVPDKPASVENSAAIHNDACGANGRQVRVARNNSVPDNSVENYPANGRKDARSADKPETSCTQSSGHAQNETSAAASILNEPAENNRLQAAIDTRTGTPCNPSSGHAQPETSCTQSSGHAQNETSAAASILNEPAENTRLQAAIDTRTENPCRQSSISTVPENPCNQSAASAQPLNPGIQAAGEPGPASFMMDPVGVCRSVFVDNIADICGVGRGLAARFLGSLAACGYSLQKTAALCAMPPVSGYGVFMGFHIHAYGVKVIESRPERYLAYQDSKKEQCGARQLMEYAMPRGLSCDLAVPMPLNPLKFFLTGYGAETAQLESLLRQGLRLPDERLAVWLDLFRESDAPFTDCQQAGLPRLEALGLMAAFLGIWYGQIFFTHSQGISCYPVTKRAQTVRVIRLSPLLTDTPAYAPGLLGQRLGLCGEAA